ncbi:hypothetical protein ACPCTO_35885 [Streptomyces olivoreticuli]
MNPSTPHIKIHVLDPDAHDDDVPLTDVGVVNIDGERHLFLSPQSFCSAVRQVSAAMPDLPLEQVERLVRDHCEFKDFDELLGPAEPAPPVDLPPHSEEPPASVRPSGRTKKWIIAAALLPALAGAWALGHFTAAVEHFTGAAPTLTAEPKATGDNRNLGPEPFTAPDFKDFSVAGKIRCSPIDNLEAECTDSDGMVMATKAATGPDSTIFTFSYGKQRLGLRIFGTAEYANTWAMQDASRELYPNMVLTGRYVLWGTDKERLKGYEAELLAAASKKSAAGARQVTAMGGAEPLPPRLAALTLGTLGLDEHDVQTILFDPQDAPVDAPVLLAARAVLGVPDATPSVLKPGEADIVALAAGLEPPPVTGPDTRTTVTPVTDPASGANSTGGSSEEPTETATTVGTAPSPDPTPKPEPRPDPRPDPRPEPTPVEPEEPPTAPVDPAPIDLAPPVTDTSAPSPEPDPAQTQPPTGGAVQEPPASDGQTPSDGQDGELLALPQAWIAPAA